MIVSHRHRYIFFAVPKTATHAIRQALRKSLGSDDWEQQTLFGKQYLPIPALAAIDHGHIAVRQLKPHLPAGQWDSYFKFAFVRDPFDRFVSTCFFLNRRAVNFRATAIAFMKEAIRRPRFRKRALGRPQADMLIDGAGELALDYVGRYETLQESFAHICGEIGIPPSELFRTNASQHEAFASYYDEELIELIGEFYRDDLQLFGYERPAAG